MTTNIGTTTTYFVGAHYQVDNGVVTKYYFAGAQRVAMRKGSTLSYLLGDHLGSTSLTTNTSGTLVSELRYKPWGETRYTSGTMPTQYPFTGQRNEVSIGLYFYNARWYDPTIGRFAQADSIVPGGVQGLDRYAYANNNPLNFTDPSGHVAIGDSNEGGCNTPGSPRCILDKYYGSSTDNEWMMDMELYYYQQAYPEYDAGTDPYLDPSQIATVMAPTNRAGCIGGSFWSCVAMGIQGGIGTSIAKPIINRPAEPAPQNYGDYADPDCPGCGYDWDLSMTNAPGGEPQTTVLGFSEDVAPYSNVDVNILNNQPYYNWGGMNIQFLKAGMYRGDTFVFVSNYRGSERLFAHEVKYLMDAEYTYIVDIGVYVK